MILVITICKWRTFICSSEPLEHDVRRGRAVAQRRRDPDERVVLVADERDVDGAAIQDINGAVGTSPIDPVELLVLEVFQARHERDPEQGAKAKELLGEAVYWFGVNETALVAGYAGEG